MNHFFIDKDNPTPLYYQLQKTIIEKIDNGTYQEDESLPPETIIIKESGLSRTTVRQAIENLVNEGYLEKRRGIGTFVIPRKKHLWNLQELRSFREEFETNGNKSSTKLLSIEKIKKNDELIKIFGNEVTDFYKIERLRFLNETPVIVVTTYVPVVYANGLEEDDLSNNSLFAIMKEKYNVKIGFAEKEFRAKKVEEEDSILLNIKNNEPIQHVETRTYDIGGAPVEYSISRDRGDISVYKIILKKSE